MNLGTILVHLDHTPRCVVRIDLAARLAMAHGSHLVGLVPTGLVNGSIPTNTIPTGSTDLIATAADYLRVRAEAITHVFKDAIRGAASLSWSVRLADGGAAEAVIHHGRASDLVVVGQADGEKIGHDNSAASATRDFPQQVVLHTGRPVLIVPRMGRFEDVGRSVLVAWDATRESGLALREALPLLDKGSRVTLLSVRKPDDGRDDAFLQAPEMVDWLRRHGVHAMPEQCRSTESVVDTLLTCAAGMGADLLVMGGYGHHRLREQVLGGATREMLATMTVPVLMAH